MPRYAAVNLSPTSAVRARELAKRAGRALGRYLDELIDAEHASIFGDPEADDIVVAEDESGTTIGIQLVADDGTAIVVPIPAGQAEGVAESIERMAREGGAAILNCDLNPWLLISRRGTGVVLEVHDDRQKVRRSYSVDAAIALAAALRRAIPA